MTSFILLLSTAKYRSMHGKGLIILTLKLLFLRLPIGLAQVNAGNNSENVLYKIRQFVYSLYQ